MLHWVFAGGGTTSMKPPQRLRDLDKDEYQRILRRAAVKTESILSVIIPIVKEVEKRGDAAVTKFTAQFDGVDLAPKDFQVSQKRVKAAYEKVSPELIVSLKNSVLFLFFLLDILLSSKDSPTSL
ncbi:unnamed protein product [marine sediment metagenome]|uniref:Histidinol dehydrogenase n=1 Tax=marine sediment metagenome TaxID=412755 RepID=X1HDS2_9ZZZZ